TCSPSTRPTSPATSPRTDVAPPAGSDTGRRPSSGGGRLYLDTPVTYLKGVGPRRAEQLARLNISTAGDLLFHVPHRYEDASTVASIASLEPGMDGTVIG